MAFSEIYVRKKHIRPDQNSAICFKRISSTNVREFLYQKITLVMLYCLMFYPVLKLYWERWVRVPPSRISVPHRKKRPGHFLHLAGLT